MIKEKIKILWVVNLVLPKVAHLVGQKEIPFGGWVSNMLERLSKDSSFDIAVVMRAPVRKTMIERIDNIQYYIIPLNPSDKFDVLQNDCDFVLSHFKPILLHVEGSESAHARRFLSTWKGKNVVSMQGILKGYEPYEYGGLSFSQLIKVSKIKALFIMSAMKINKWINFNKRVAIERETITKAHNILGRTHWDRAHSHFINRTAPYFTCNRILRRGFYNKKWNIKKINRHQVFIGNSAQARKGAHIVIQAVSLLQSEYPDIQLLVAGDSPFMKHKFDWKNRVGYRAYLVDKIKSLNLTKTVKFLGVLSEKEMIQTLCHSHVFVMGSIVENSPNTLGEAMIIGVPSISSYMGGVSDMAQDGEEALFYRDNDPVLLAMRIKQIFDSDELALRLSQNGRSRALSNHDPQKNYSNLIKAYDSILSISDLKSEIT